MFRLLSPLAVLAALGWAFLYFMGMAVLVWESSPPEAGMMKTFTCTYFDGMKLLKKEQVYSDIPVIGQVGSARCKRIIDLNESAI